MVLKAGGTAVEDGAGWAFVAVKILLADLALLWAGQLRHSTNCKVYNKSYNLFSLVSFGYADFVLDQSDIFARFHQFAVEGSFELAEIARMCKKPAELSFLQSFDFKE
jgi:hypothetical protein